MFQGFYPAYYLSPRAGLSGNLVQRRNNLEAGNDTKQSTGGKLQTQPLEATIGSSIRTHDTL